MQSIHILRVSAMKDKKLSIKLFTWKQGIVIAVAVIVGAGFSIYRTYKEKGSLEKSDLVIGALAITTAIAFLVILGYYANRPENKD